MSFSPECRDLLKRRHSQDELHRDMTGTTDFEVHHATQNGDLERVKALLEESPDKLTQVNLLGQTPLHLATVEGHMDIAFYLLDQGGNPNARNSLGKTPLMRAVDRNRVNIARILIEFGGDVNIKADSGATAWSMAVKAKNQELIDLFQPYVDESSEEEEEHAQSPPKIHPAHSEVEKGLSEAETDDSGFVGFNNSESNRLPRDRRANNAARLSVEFSQEELDALIKEVEAAEVEEYGNDSDGDEQGEPYEATGDKSEPNSISSVASVELHGYATADPSNDVPDRRNELPGYSNDGGFVGFNNQQSSFAAEKEDTSPKKKSMMKRRSKGYMGDEPGSPGSPDMPSEPPAGADDFVGFSNDQSTFSKDRTALKAEEAKLKMRVRTLSVADFGGGSPASDSSSTKKGLPSIRSSPRSPTSNAEGAAAPLPSPALSRSSGMLSQEEINEILAEGEEKKRAAGLVYDSDDSPTGSPAISSVAVGSPKLPRKSLAKISADDSLVPKAAIAVQPEPDTISSDATGYQSPSLADLSQRKMYRKSSFRRDAERQQLTSILTVRSQGGDVTPMDEEGEFVGFNNDGSSYAAQVERKKSAGQTSDDWSD